MCFELRAAFISQEANSIAYRPVCKTVTGQLEPELVYDPFITFITMLFCLIVVDELFHS